MRPAKAGEAFAVARTSAGFSPQKPPNLSRPPEKLSRYVLPRSLQAEACAPDPAASGSPDGPAAAHLGRRLRNAGASSGPHSLDNGADVLCLHCSPGQPIHNQGIITLLNNN